MAGEWEFRPARCKGTSFKEKDKCPTLVADSLTLSSNPVCAFLKRTVWANTNEFLTLGVKGSNSVVAVHSPAWLCKEDFFFPVLWVHEEGEPLWSVSCYDFCHSIPLHISIVAALTEAAKGVGCAWAALKELGYSCSVRGGASGKSIFLISSLNKG